MLNRTWLKWMNTKHLRNFQVGILTITPFRKAQNEQKTLYVLLDQMHTNEMVCWLMFWATTTERRFAPPPASWRRNFWRETFTNKLFRLCASDQGKHIMFFAHLGPF